MLKSIFFLLNFNKEMESMGRVQKKEKYVEIPCVFFFDEELESPNCFSVNLESLLQLCKETHLSAQNLFIQKSKKRPSYFSNLL